MYCILSWDESVPWVELTNTIVQFANTLIKMLQTALV